MPRRRFIDKKSATTFSLVYRAQNDARIHDPEASDMVFTEKANPNRNKSGGQRGDVEDEFALTAGSSGSASASGKIKRLDALHDEFGWSVRENEGEAANHGIYFDDSDYDYMQHLRDLGGSGEAYFVEAPVRGRKGKGKDAVSLEDALKDVDVRSEGGASNATTASLAESIFPEDMLASEFVQKRTYQDQQDIPDAIAGFQPDMDPRLREVLEALDDEAYVDDDDDLFGALAQNGEEVSLDEWEASPWQDAISEEDDGWESDHTVKADGDEQQQVDPSTPSDHVPHLSETKSQDTDWMAEYSKFKKDSTDKSAKKPAGLPLDLQSSVQTGASSIAGLRRKKRKGALTSSTGYSMTSSVLARTEGQSILDQRFDKIQEKYGDEDNDDFDDDVSMLSGLSKMSTTSQGAPRLVRADFDSIMDDFLGEYSSVGKRRVKKGRPQTGMEQLDEIRKDMGPARLDRTQQV